MLGIRAFLIDACSGSSVPALGFTTAFLRAQEVSGWLRHTGAIVFQAMKQETFNLKVELGVFPLWCWAFGHS